jgi:hypothetical protein
MPAARQPGNAATRTVLMPGFFRQEQIAVDQGVKVARDITKMDTDDTVFLLAATATPLPLNTGGLLALFVKTRLVDDPDNIGLIRRIVSASMPLASCVRVPLEHAIDCPPEVT